MGHEDRVWPRAHTNASAIPLPEPRSGRALCYLRAGGGAAWKMRELGASLSRRPRVSAEVQAAWSEGLINAVPGPSTVVLLIIGLAGMAARNWCRRKV